MIASATAEAQPRARTSSFSLATNFDPALLEAVRSYPVVEVYGKLPRDAVGGGRASVMLTPLSGRRLRRHVEEAHRAGIQFNYLLNGACLDNVEFTRRGQRKIQRLLGRLDETGVDAVTVAIPFLAALVKRRFPRLRVRVSVFAGVDESSAARFWEDLGADVIALNGPFVNRDFAVLRRIRQAVRCELELLANNSCLQYCPMTSYHKNLLAHASQSGHRTGGFVIDYCYLWCSRRKLLHPAEYIRSDWIRPEDLQVYEAMGYRRFKLTDRTAPTDSLVRRVRAYSERRYDGNLLDLVQPFGYAKTDEAQGRFSRWWWIARHLARPWTVRLSRLRALGRLLSLRGMLAPCSGPAPVWLDNRSLDGFLERWPKDGCRRLDCAECRYCDGVAARAVRIDPGYREECLALYDRVFDDMHAGRLWFASAPSRR